LVRGALPDVEVSIGYLDHGSPRLAQLTTTNPVVVPLLLSSGYHVKTDIPAAVPDARVSAAVGPDPLLAAVLAQRLTEAGWAGESPVTLAAAGSADPEALADVATAAAQLAELIGVNVTPAFLSSGTPRLAEVDAAAVASYLLAPGRFAAQVAAHRAAVISAPIGADPRVAEIIRSRYDAALSSH
jgi:sirohydrochlorin ferrochelatase